MALTINAKTFNQDAAKSADIVPYLGPLNTLSVRDVFTLSRSAPKPTSIFSGQARSGVKFQRTLTLTGALTTTGVATIDVAHSIPVGASSADQDTLCADMASWYGGANAKSHMKSQTLLF